MQRNPGLEGTSEPKMHLVISPWLEAYKCALEGGTWSDRLLG